jgi:hypothetical protein
MLKEEGHDEGANKGPSKQHKTGARLCSICRKSIHNARTCSEAEEVDGSSTSEVLDSTECYFG